MADKKSTTTKKSTAKSKSTTSKSTKSRKPSYEKVVVARRSMERAHAEVMSAERSLRSARTIMSDFKIRDAEVAKAEEDLAQARARAAKATADFQELKYGSK